MREARIQKLKTLLEKDPEDSFSQYALALEYAGMGDDSGAITILERLIQRSPTYVPSYQQLGYQYQKSGRDKEASATFKEGIRIAGLQGDSNARREMQEALDELESNQ